MDALARMRRHVAQTAESVTDGFPHFADPATGTWTTTVSLATALNPYIGYAKAAEIAKESVATGRSIIEIAREKKLVSEKEIEEILDPVRMTEPRPPLDSAKKREEKR